MSFQPVLYSEDDENDAFFLKRAFKQAQIPNPLIILPDGQTAIDYCAGVGSFADRDLHPLPGLVLLDLKMPRKTGMEVLAWLREQPSLSHLPVFILTSSSQEEDIRRACGYEANGYLVKPSDPEELRSMVQAIQDYWLQQNRQAIKPWNLLPSD